MILLVLLRFIHYHRIYVFVTNFKQPHRLVSLGAYVSLKSIGAGKHDASPSFLFASISRFNSLMLGSVPRKHGLGIVLHTIMSLNRV